MSVFLVLILSLLLLLPQNHSLCNFERNHYASNMREERKEKNSRHVCVLSAASWKVYITIEFHSYTSTSHSEKELNRYEFDVNFFSLHCQLRKVMRDWKKLTLRIYEWWSDDDDETDSCCRLLFLLCKIPLNITEGKN